MGSLHSEPKTVVAQSRAFDLLELLAAMGKARNGEWSDAANMPNFLFDGGRRYLLACGAIRKTSRRHIAPYVVTPLGYQMLVKEMV